MFPYLRLDNTLMNKKKKEKKRITLTAQISSYLNDMHLINR